MDTLIFVVRVLAMTLIVIGVAGITFVTTSKLVNIVSRKIAMMRK